MIPHQATKSRRARILILCAVAILAASSMSFGMEQLTQKQPFGDVFLYPPSGPPERVVLMISGPEGWKGRVVEMAESLAGQGALVAGIDLKSYLENVAQQHVVCPAGHFEGLARFVERTAAIQDYMYPILLGYEDGGELAYVSLAEAPNEFSGAVSFDFSAGFSSIPRHLCRSYAPEKQKGGGFRFPPAQDLQTPWIVLQEKKHDQGSEYVRQVPHGEWIEAGKHWEKKLNEACVRLGKVASTTHSGLPVMEQPSNAEKDTLIFILSGDGGYVSLDRDIGNFLVTQGYSVVGFDCLRYYWQDHSPDEAANDLNHLILDYLSAWKKKKALLIGFSWGADVLPFIANRFPDSTLPLIQGVALLGPSLRAEFQIDPSEPGKQRALLPEIRKLSGIQVLCIGGETEKSSICRNIEASNKNVGTMIVDMVSGGHMLDRDYQELSRIILQKLGVEKNP